MDKLLGFVPDAEPTTPGILTSVTNMIPWEQGMRGAPRGATPSGVPALAAECRGAAVVTKLDDTRRIFAGTATKLYELSAGAWVDSGFHDHRQYFFAKPAPDRAQGVGRECRRNRAGGTAGPRT